MCHQVNNFVGIGLWLLNPQSSLNTLQRLSPACLQTSTATAGQPVKTATTSKSPPQRSLSNGTAATASSKRSSSQITGLPVSQGISVVHDKRKQGFKTQRCWWLVKHKTREELKKSRNKSKLENFRLKCPICFACTIRWISKWQSAVSKASKSKNKRWHPFPKLAFSIEAVF